jgi:hypothetical protein
MSTNPFKIPIGTSDPVDICRGLPLFPGLGTARAGITGAGRSDKFLDISATISITRLKLSAYYSWGFGICGPAIGFLSPNVDVLRENLGNRGKLTLTFNEGLEMEAGLFVGASVGLGLSLGLQVYLPRPWYKLWSFAWQDAFAVDFAFSLDIISLLFELIKFLLSKTSKSAIAPDSQNRLGDALPDLKKTFSILDQVGTSTLTKDLTATPKLTLPFNLANYFAPLKAANDRLSKIGGEISFGPSIHLQFPVKFNFTKFTISGGLQDDATTADYGPADYHADNRVSATGPIEFNLARDPSRVTSHVKYETGFGVGVSVHFKVGVAKFFSIERNTPSLDLTYLLTRSGQRLAEVESQVSTSVSGGCVLEPVMTLAFSGSNGNSTNFVTGQTVRGTINLPGFTSPTGVSVGLSINPPVPGFPSELKIPAGQRTASFNFIFRNQCLATGNLNNPAQTASPSAVTPLQTYTVRASLPTTSSEVCANYEVEQPLNITQRFIRCQRASGSTATPGPAPAWDRLAGATINADPSQPTDGNKLDSVQFSLWFPYLDNETAVRVPVTFTLLDENRQPYAGSNVQIISLQGLSPTTLKPSAKGNLLLQRGPVPAVCSLSWKSKGPVTGYSNRFYLIVDAGCLYGQTEFWLNVYNWS